jgi:hypothetical protein
MAQAAEINRAKQTAEAPRQQSMDSLALNRAKSWAAENNWFKPDGKDADSAVVKALDESLMAEGFNPATQEYWDELTDRASRYLPHRFAESDDLLGPGLRIVPELVQRDVFHLRCIDKEIGWE